MAIHKQRPAVAVDRHRHHAARTRRCTRRSRCSPTSPSTPISARRWSTSTAVPARSRSTTASPPRSAIITARSSPRAAGGDALPRCRSASPNAKLDRSRARRCPPSSATSGDTIVTSDGLYVFNGSAWQSRLSVGAAVVARRVRGPRQGWRDRPRARRRGRRRSRHPVSQPLGARLPGLPAAPARHRRARSRRS